MAERLVIGSDMNYHTKIYLLLKCARVARQLSTGFGKKPNFYELLGVSPKATVEEIKNAYFEKTKLYHPDVAGSSDENLTLFRQVSEAYEVLGSPTLRKDYDQNVLGLAMENQNNSEDDPIAMYRSRMRNVNNSSWTQEHYNKLRKQQYAQGSYRASTRPSTTTTTTTTTKRARNSQDSNFFPITLLLISFGLVITVHFNRDGLEKILKS